MNSPARHNAEPPFEIRTSLLPDQPEIPPHAPSMDDIYGVGPDKPLGCLPIDTIAKYGEDLAAVIDLSQRRGLSTVLCEDEEERPNHRPHRASLYVYDEQALQALLQANTRVVEGNRWPTDPAAFVDRVMHDLARRRDLFTLIAWAFRDRRPEYQREPLTEKIPVVEANPQTTLRLFLRKVGTTALRK